MKNEELNSKSGTKLEEECFKSILSMNHKVSDIKFKVPKIKLPMKMQKMVKSKKRKERIKKTILVAGSIVLAITMAYNHKELKINKEA